MYCIMFEAKNEEAGKLANEIMNFHNFKKYALLKSNMFKIDGNNELLNIKIALDELQNKLKGELENVFVCKLDDVSNFSDQF